MVKFRERSNESLPAELANEQELEKCIKRFHTYYFLITQIVDVADRVTMLAKCRFMENISVFKDVFDEDEKTYLKGCSLPAAMKATPGGLKILSNHEVKKWIKSYYFAITSPEIIKYNVKAYRGLTLEKMRELSKKRGEASGWFEFYPKEVTKENVAQLKQALLMDSQVIQHEEFFKNHLMQPFYERYVNLAMQFRLLDNQQLALDKDGVSYRREHAYWDSLQSIFNPLLIVLID